MVVRQTASQLSTSNKIKTNFSPGGYYQPTRYTQNNFVNVNQRVNFRITLNSGRELDQKNQAVHQSWDQLGLSSQYRSCDEVTPSAEYGSTANQLNQSRFNQSRNHQKQNVSKEQLKIVSWSNKSLQKFNTSNQRTKMVEQGTAAMSSERQRLFLMDDGSARQANISRTNEAAKSSKNLLNDKITNVFNQHRRSIRSILVGVTVPSSQMIQNPSQQANQTMQYFNRKSVDSDAATLVLNSNTKRASDSIGLLPSKSPSYVADSSTIPL